MNQLVTINDTLENISDEELSVLSDRLVLEKMNRMSKKLETLETKLEETNANVEKMRIENTELVELERKRHRLEEHRYGYVTATQLGQGYAVTIGSQSMGKLLKMAGLAKVQGRTEPLMSAIQSDYAKVVQYGDHIGYNWNPERCVKKIDKWLNKKGIIDDFYAIEDEAELIGYISQLYSAWELERN